MKIDISIGELIDKVTILMIKSEKIADAEKLKNVRHELSVLTAAMKTISMDTIDDKLQLLKTVNLKLWDIEDRIRYKESEAAFDDEFIQLARSVYIVNDQRAAIKKTINIESGSELVEEKEYTS